jgi:hypothetical protein
MEVALRVYMFIIVNKIASHTSSHFCIEEDSVIHPHTQKKKEENLNHHFPALRIKKN